MGKNGTRSWSRRDFLKGAAAGTVSVAALGAMAGCSPQQTSSGASEPTASTEAGSYDVMKELSTFNRGEKPDAKAPATPEEYITMKGDGVLSAGGGCDPLGIKPADFMLNKPAWLGDAPEVTDIADTEECDVLVIGAGNAGTTSALRCQEEGASVILAEMQTYDEYDEYACDMACYNSKLFLDKGTPEIDATEVFNEYMRLSRGHAHQKIVRDYATRSGEMLDWLTGHIPAEYVEKYAKTSNYKGNENFNGECCGQKSWPAMTQWRDEETNINMWPFVIRSVHTAFEEAGGAIKWGYQGVVLVQDGDAVTGAVFQDVDGAYHRINAKAVVVAAGDFGGNPDMRLDLADTMRNLAWSYGNDRTDASSIGGMGRDGSGIRMCLWAGGTMEGGPRAGQSCGINGVPGFAFGGAWPCFGNDGKRFMNETMVKHGSNGYLDMLPEGQLLVNVTDANWEEYLSHQGFGHETMDRSSDYMVAEVRENMANYKTGKDGFDVRAFSRFGKEYSTVYAADTLEELADIVGYSGEAKESFLAEVERYNELCAKGHDDDWGCDPQNLLPIKDAPFFASFGTTGGNPSGGLCQHAAVCTDGGYRVLTGDKQPIPGLYAAGNTCGQRYGIQYATPTAGNSCGSALTSGYCAAESVIADLA
ncbi:FAD-binding protein [Enteroscipio rubneri]|uniref:FAD-binding dehydrogenase n=1 Tax=Enteroscipio rubneri TaxID=2070686 RepID=A0A2K2UC63_9ACTN|nr:FAD-binding protein [Enteroscipio rubneri]PNV67917.1 FAD-binding dehydrogenase [Enteroscipio rubneri]